MSTCSRARARRPWGRRAGTGPGHRTRTGAARHRARRAGTCARRRAPGDRRRAAGRRGSGARCARGRPTCAAAHRASAAGSASGSRRLPLPCRRRGPPLPGGFLGAGHDPAHRRAAEQVKPRHPVGAAGGVEDGERLVEIGDAVGVDRQPGRGQAAQADRRRQDQPGQAHPADRRRQGGRIVAGIELENLTGGGEQRQCHDVAAERAGAPVVLAVDVRSDRAADADVLGAGDDRQDPAGRCQRVQQLGERDPGLGGDEPLLRIERKPVQAAGVQQAPGGELGRVAVAAAHPPRQDRRAPTGPGPPRAARRRRPRGRPRRARGPVPPPRHDGRHGWRRCERA